METKLYIVRHGQTEASVKKYVQGRGLKVPLIQAGREQAERLATGLKEYKFNRIFTSTAVRTIDTADIVRQYHSKVPVEKIFELNERSKGKTEGMSKDDFEEKYPEIIEKWNNEEDVRVADGENFEDVEKRVVPVLERHLLDHKGENILYVLHGNVIGVIIGYMLGIPYNLRPRIKQNYCALNIFSYDYGRKRWAVEAVNRIFE